MVGDGFGNQSVQARMVRRRVILVVDLCPRAPPLRRRLLQRRRGAWEVVHERMQIVVCIDDIWKTEHVLGSWLVDGRYGFLLRR